MAGNSQIIELYTALAEKPSEDFGWDKGLDNAKAHNYSNQWIEKLPSQIWQYCAAVGNPFSLGKIEKGSTILDLGCGAGVDVLVSAYLTGKTGKIIGVDITPKMVQKAKEHAALAGFSNVEILESSFDDINIEDESVDLVISNGAINLTSCKESVFAEIYRVLKPNGKIMFADMIDTSDENACTPCCATEPSEGDWANCVAGTLRKDKLIEIMADAGFGEIECTGLTHYTTSDTTYGATFKAKKIARDSFREAHWDGLFKTKDYTQVLWHQNSPEHSVELVKQYTSSKDAIIDVGCGASFLVDKLIQDGYTNISLLDTSKTSLDIVKKRLDSHADLPKYICSDIMNFHPKEKYSLWHDRALFHFLTLKQERIKYFEILKESLTLNAVSIINTFSLDSQTQCAGLNIVQYDDKKMVAELPEGLELIKYTNYMHTTPAQTQQAYSSFIIKRTL